MKAEVLDGWGLGNSRRLLSSSSLRSTWITRGGRAGESRDYCDRSPEEAEASIVAAGVNRVFSE